MVEDAREPIGRKIRLLHPIKQKMYYQRFVNKRFNNYKSLFLNSDKSKKYKFYNKNNWFWLLVKLLIVFMVLIIIYGIYLDWKIRNRIDGKVWQLPAAVYGRMINLEPEMSINKKEMVKLLEATQYRRVSKILRSGEFTVKKNSIEMIRRPFAFPDKKEKQLHVRLTFDGECLETIKSIDNKRQFGFFRLEPRLITMISTPNSEQRLFVIRQDFPDLLISTLLATEDRYFYDHDGVNFYSMCRAVLANLVAKRTVQGASTLTQQLIKNLFLSSKRSYWRKVNEVYMALLMEARYDKDRILELYMNEVYLGQNGNNEIRGFPLASFYYFDRPVEEISLDQQALLVGMVKGASIYNPWRNPNLALERRNLVLHILLQQHIIDQELYSTLITRPLGVQSRNDIISSQPAFMQMLHQELQAKLGDKIKSISGAKIFTTFDYIAQDAVEKAVLDGIPKLKKQRKLEDLETAVVVVDRYTGEIRAVVGGSEPQYAGYNRAMQARRSIGSLAKPATYFTALSRPNQYRLNTWIADTPISLCQDNGQVWWSPQNDDRQFSGQVMLVDALTRSMNVPTVNLGMALGLPSIIDTWQKLGVPKDQLHPVPAMILGSLNLTPIEVAQAFQTIASGGNRASLSTLRSVIAEDGTILYQSYPQVERTVSAQASYMTLWTMQQVVQHGTGRQLGIEYPYLHIAGKTGTTNNNIDTWFAGIDGCEVVITWVGRDNNQPTKLYGANGAMLIYKLYIGNRSPKPLKLVAPEGIVLMNIDDLGNCVCGNGVRSLPVWKTNQYSFCQKNNLEQLTENLFTQYVETQEASQKNNNISSGITDWIRKMFNGN